MEFPTVSMFTKKNPETQEKSSIEKVLFLKFNRRTLQLLHASLTAILLTSCSSVEQPQAKSSDLKPDQTSDQASHRSAAPSAVQTSDSSALTASKNKKVIISLSHGKEIFERSNCSMCHPGGNNTMDPGHPIKGLKFAQKYNDDNLLEATIRKGFPDVGMPAFNKKQIDDVEMKDLIAYVRTLTPSAPATSK